MTTGAGELALLLLLLFAGGAAGQSTGGGGGGSNYPVSFRPSVAIVIGIFAIMFTLTFLLLMYAKFCHIAASDLFAPGGPLAGAGDPLAGAAARLSGVDKTVIESLPFFRFSALRGSRAGLECSVCLSKFEDTEVLRLLPKCKHAFHIGCVDRWLENHSSCPLCRYRVTADDVAVSSSRRISIAGGISSRRAGSPAAASSEFELFVEREKGAEPISRFGMIGSSFRMITRRSETPEAELGSGSATDLAPAVAGEEDPEIYHRFKHQIVFSDMVFKRRWSDVNSADMKSLQESQMLAGGVRRASAGAGEVVVTMEEEMGRKRAFEVRPTPEPEPESSSSGPTGLDASVSTKSLIGGGGGRSMSEITNVSRFTDVRGRLSRMMVGEEERAGRIWIPIARRTVQWFAGREQRAPAAAAQSPAMPRYSREITDDV